MEKKYQLTVTRTGDGTLNINATNDGFNPFEVLGFLEYKVADIRDQIKGNIQPDIEKRTVIKD